MSCNVFRFNFYITVQFLTLMIAIFVCLFKSGKISEYLIIIIYRLKILTLCREISAKNKVALDYQLVCISEK